MRELIWSHAFTAMVTKLTAEGWQSSDKIAEMAAKAGDAYVAFYELARLNGKVNTSLKNR